MEGIFDGFIPEQGIVVHFPIRAVKVFGDFAECLHPAAIIIDEAWITVQRICCAPIVHFCLQRRYPVFKERRRRGADYALCGAKYNLSATECCWKRALGFNFSNKLIHALVKIALGLNRILLRLERVKPAVFKPFHDLLLFWRAFSFWRFDCLNKRVILLAFWPHGVNPVLHAKAHVQHHAKRLSSIFCRPAVHKIFKRRCHPTCHMDGCNVRRVKEREAQFYRNPCVLESHPSTECVAFESGVLP